MDYPQPSKIKIGQDRIAVIKITRARAYYSEGGQHRLAAGEVLVTVNFDTPMKDTNWVGPFLHFWNSADPEIEIVQLAATGRVLKSQAGFTLLLDAPPPTDNYYMDFSIAEKTQVNS